MPSFLTGKKLILLGFIIVLLVAIPLTVYLVQQQQKTKSSAVAATTVTFVPPTKTVNVGDTFSLDVNVDPGGVNQISFVKLLILYDATKLSTSAAGLVVDSWKATDGTNFTPSVLQGPTYGPGTISLTISVGSSPQNVIQKVTKVATVNFSAIAPTDTGAPSQVQFGNQTQVLSIGSSDQFNENVLSSAPPANITINAGTVVTPTDTPTPTIANVTTTPTFTPTPTTATVTPTDTPTPIPGATATPTFTPTPTAATVTSNTAPTCSSLTLDRAANGTLPYNLNFTANGNSSNSTISSVTFNFGDGQTQTITSSGGIGTSSVSVLQSHIYNAAGTFTATATLTDANGNVSAVGVCSTTVTIFAPTQIATNPSPLPATGPSQLVTVGAIGAILTVIGALLLFAL